MGKTNVIILNADMTFDDKKTKSEGTNLPLDKNWSPSFTPGKSVFTENVPRWKFWRKQRKIIIIPDEAMKAFELDAKGKKISVSLWTRKEREKFIAKVIAKSKAAQKPFSNWQVFAILGFLAVIFVFQILTMRGMRIV